MSGILSNISISLYDVLRFALWLISGYGLSRFFKKFEIEGWWAFIPGARIYWLARCADREQDGKTAMILQLLMCPTYAAYLILDADSPAFPYVSILSLFFGIGSMIYKARICIDLCSIVVVLVCVVKSTEGKDFRTDSNKTDVAWPTPGEPARSQPARSALRRLEPTPGRPAPRPHSHLDPGESREPGLAGKTPPNPSPHSGDTGTGAASSVDRPTRLTPAARRTGASCGPHTPWRRAPGRAGGDAPRARSNSAPREQK